MAENAAILYPEELAAAKAYLRLDGDEEDPLVTGLVLAARAYLTQAGVTLPAPDDARRPLYDLCCHGLALGYYERRETEGEMPLNLNLRMILNQLKMTEPPVVSDLDTDAEPDTSDGEEGGGDGGNEDP